MDDKFTAIVLAGDRGPDDPVAKAAGVSCKALAPIAGRPMVLRVIDALREASAIDSIIVCGSMSRLRGQSPEMDGLIGAGRIRWVESQSTPSTSAQAALSILSENKRALVTTADHALLAPRIVDHFCREAAETGCDVVAGLARAEMVKTAFPEGRRTITRLRDGGYCGCNLFAFLTPRSRNAVTFWRRVEEHRKHPLKIVKTLGYGAVIRYLFGWLTLDDGLSRMSSLMNARAGAIWMPFAEAAVDVDTVDDWNLVENYLSQV